MYGLMNLVQNQWDCAAARPDFVVGHYSTPVFDQTGTIVTGWNVVAGEEPADFVNPCPSTHTKRITGVIPISIQSCVAEPAPQLNHW